MYLRVPVPAPAIHPSLTKHCVAWLQTRASTATVRLLQDDLKHKVNTTLSVAWRGACFVFIFLVHDTHARALCLPHANRASTCVHCEAPFHLECAPVHASIERDDDDDEPMCNKCYLALPDV